MESKDLKKLAFFTSRFMPYERNGKKWQQKEKIYGY